MLTLAILGTSSGRLIYGGLVSFGKGQIRWYVSRWVVFLLTPRLWYRHRGIVSVIQ